MASTIAETPWDARMSFFTLSFPAKALSNIRVDFTVAVFWSGSIKIWSKVARPPFSATAEQYSFLTTRLLKHDRWRFMSSEASTLAKKIKCE